MARKKKDSRKKPRKKERKSKPGPQPSSLNEALFFWLSKKSAFIQNTILTAFGVCALLFFSAKVIDVTKALLRLIPIEVPEIYGVIRNESDHTVKIDKTGHFIIHASPPVEGKYDLYTVAATDNNQITVRGKGGEVNVYAKINNTPEVCERYRIGQDTLTLKLSEGTQRYVAQIDKFSKAGLKKGKVWKVSIPKNVTPERIIKVCFEELGDSSKRSILQDRPYLSEWENDEAFLKNETIELIEDVKDMVQRRQFFRMNDSPQYYYEVLDGKMPPPPPSTVLAKIAVGVYVSEKDENKKMIFVEVTDTLDKIGMEDRFTYRSYSSESREGRVLQIITDATRAIVAKYPIEGRVSDVSREGDIVEIGIGRLAGIRNYMTLYAYCGELYVGDIKITATWPGTCEGTWDPCYKGYQDARTSFLVCSRKKVPK